MPACDWLPEWIGQVGGPCWVCDPQGRLVHANAAAGRLLACEGSAATDLACCAALRGVDEAGRAYCGPECAALRRAREHRPVEPFLLRLGAARGAGEWFLVWIIPLTAPDGSGPWLVHCAGSVDRLHRMEEYLREVATRTPPAAAVRRAPAPRLTAREREILALLAHDQDQHRIAARLFLSYATVRNHVEHILAKLGVHSIQEAVAWQLLQAGPEPGGAAPTERASGAD